MDTIPLIDLSPFTDPEGSEEAKAKTIKEWNEAFRAVGFASIVGHGVDEDLTTGLFDEALRFFELSESEKRLFAHNSEYGNPGYTPRGVEAVGRTLFDSNATADSVESLVYHDGSLDIMPEALKRPIVAYWQSMETLLKLIMEITAVSLDLDPKYFDPFYDQPQNALRLAYYPQDQQSLKYGAHTDYTGFTVLRQDDFPGGGLQVYFKNLDSWIDVPYQKGAFVINAGDLIQRWTNDVYLSNVHRVVASPLAKDAEHGRLSMVYFTGPRGDAIITPIESCCKSIPCKYPPITANDHLQMKLNKSNVAQNYIVRFISRVLA